MPALTIDQIRTYLGDQAQTLLDFNQPKISRDMLQLPSSDFVDRVFSASDRSQAVQANLKRLFNSGRLAGTGYLSILPVDQGIEHGAGASFATNPTYFDPENIVKLALEGGCNGVASTLGVLGMTAKKYAGQIPFIVKLNHNELLTYPNKHDQILFGTAQQAAEMGAAGVGATVYFGSPESNRQLAEISRVFAEAHRLGLFTILWCYTRNPGFTKDGVNYETAADITGQANHLGVTIEADIIKQKAPTLLDGLRQVNYSKFSDVMYDNLLSPHPIDLTRYQVANCYAGRAGLINSGGASSGESDLAEAITTAVINKRAGGMGLIAGRKAFQRPLADGVAILNAIQDVYLNSEVTIA
jgi:class I fructose-bisphosphate aldolase